MPSGHYQMSSPFVAAPPSYPLIFNLPFSRRHFDTNARAPSPPPAIATMPNSHSPSPSGTSVDRSSNSTPHIRRSPPMQPPPTSAPSYSYGHHDRHFAQSREPINPYIYAPPAHAPAFDPHQRYDHHAHAHHQQHHYSTDPSVHHYVPPPSGLPGHYPPPVMQQQSYRQYPLPGQAPVTVVHTDDAATKLTDGIRRRCFNCCTTDTSTWRRSNLSPGKVVCSFQF